jgi:hypothetical protein
MINGRLEENVGVDCYHQKGGNKKKKNRRKKNKFRGHELISSVC